MTPDDRSTHDVVQELLSLYALDTATPDEARQVERHELVAREAVVETARLSDPALADWIAASGLSEGPIFRRLWGTRIGPGVSPKAVAAIVQRRAALAGLAGDFGGHSLRSGFVTEGGRQGVALPALMAMTEHRSVASVIGYFQAGNAAENPAAKLLE